MAKKINIEMLRRMVADGLTMGQIANAFDVSVAAVSLACKRNSIEKPEIKAKKSKIQAAQTPRAEMAEITERTSSLIETGGRYADLAAWAERWGTTSSRAVTEWRKLRLPLKAKK